MEEESQGLVLKVDRSNLRVWMLTPDGLWNFRHPKASQGPRPGRVQASALNPPCLSWISFSFRTRGWGWLRQAQLIEALWPQSTFDQKVSAGEQLIQLRASSHMRRLILRSQQLAEATPLLFQLLLTGFRHLIKGAAPGGVLALFSIKLLIHEGLWPRPLQCSQCGQTIKEESLAALPGGLVCADCALRMGTKRVEFADFEVAVLNALSGLRDWRALGQLPFGEFLGEKMALAAELILDQR